MKVRWQNRTGDTIGELMVNETGSEIGDVSKVTATGRNPFIARNRIFLDNAYRVREFTREPDTTKEDLSPGLDGSGHWSEDSGLLPEPAGAIYIEISLTRVKQHGTVGDPPTPPAQSNPPTRIWEPCGSRSSRLQFHAKQRINRCANVYVTHI
jgi:hypothetical protein